MMKNITILSLLVSLTGCGQVLSESFFMNEEEKIEEEVIDDIIKQEEKDHPKAIT